jgi:hypothetical protein
VNRLAARDAARVAREVEARAKQLAQVQTGRLRSSIHAEPKFTFRGPTVRVSADVNYATFVENGTKPHVIRPRNKKALKFKMGGRTVFAAVVNHPGTKAVHFMAKAVREVGIRNGYDVRIT